MGLRMAVKANRDRILDIVGAVIGDLDNVVEFYFGTAETMTDTAATLACGKQHNRLFWWKAAHVSILWREGF